MINNVLVVVATVLTLVGIVGIVSKQVKGRMAGIILEVFGLVLLANCQGNDYSFFAGIEALIFEVPALILFLVLFGQMTKKNHIESLEELAGVEKKMPYQFLLLIIIGSFLIGFPGTGTFSSHMLNVASLLGAFMTAFSYIGFLGLMVGVGTLTYMIVDILRRMLVVNADDDRKLVKVSKTLTIVAAILTIIMVVFSFYQTPVIQLITKLYGTVKK